jgi:hypothetical protein
VELIFNAGRWLPTPKGVVEMVLVSRNRLLNSMPRGVRSAAPDFRKCADFASWKDHFKGAVRLI